jgi:UDP-N-acetylmuramate: L-alanyl-gamma-D-glutamyl-meso-diaminopimelate ligase
LKRVLTNGCWSRLETFGTSAGWSAGEAGADGSFEVAYAGAAVGHIRWSLLGEHNRLNALATIAAARAAGVEPAEAVAALGTFSGVRRRLEVRGEAGGVTVYDDFAHHPTAIQTTLEGLRAKVGQGRILAVLEPRSNTMKRGVLKDDLPASVKAADKVFVYTAGLGWDAGAVFVSLGARAQCLEDLAALVRAIAKEARPGDHVLVMSNGGFGGIHAKLLAALK